MKHSGFLRGLSSYADALDFIGKHKLYRYFLIPLLIGLVFFALLFGAAVYGTIVVISEINQEHPALDFFGFGVELIAVLVILIVGFITLLLCKFVINVVFSPVCSHLSEVTESKLYGREIPFPGIFAALSDVWRSLRVNIRNLFLEGLWTLLLSLLPAVNVVSPLTVFLVQSYFSGFNYMDYTLERRRMNISQTVQFVRANAGLSCGLGSVFSLLLLIPVLGWAIAPILATVAFTLSTLEILDSGQHPDYPGN